MVQIMGCLQLRLRDSILRNLFVVCQKINAKVNFLKYLVNFQRNILVKSGVFCRVMRLIFILLVFPTAIFAQNITIAVGAIQGKEKTIQQWQPTIKYLNKQLPQYQFKLHPFLPNKFSELKKSVKEDKIDFVISPPAMYVDLEVTLGASKILTLVQQNHLTQFGSVIIASKASHITKLSQINKNTQLSAVAPLGFGGWLIGYDTLKEHKINFNKKDVLFLGIQKNVVDAVIHNKVDIGVIRTGVLETLVANKQIDLDNITILNQQKYKSFPYICSSKLYPEWAFAKTKNIGDEISREVALALLSLPTTRGSTNSTGYHYQWTVPYDYKNVRDLMQRLEVGPYANQSEKYIIKFIKQYKQLFYSAIFIFILVILFLIYAKYLNTKLRKETQAKETLLKEIKEIAYYDALTKIPNRLSVIESFEHALANAQRNSSNLTVMFIDLDGFKTVNDTLGHEVGDRVLKEVADIFKTILRKNDLYGRLGGDEFIIIASGLQTEQNIKIIAHKLLDEINRISLPTPIDKEFGASIGVINIVPLRDTSAEYLLHEADNLMYEVKRQGKNNYKVEFL